MEAFIACAKERFCFYIKLILFIFWEKTFLSPFSRSFQLEKIFPYTSSRCRRINVLCGEIYIEAHPMQKGLRNRTHAHNTWVSSCFFVLFRSRARETKYIHMYMFLNSSRLDVKFSSRYSARTTRAKTSSFPHNRVVSVMIVTTRD